MMETPQFFNKIYLMNRDDLFHLRILRWWILIKLLFQ